jgi:hypothetical protein
LLRVLLAVAGAATAAAAAAAVLLAYVCPEDGVAEDDGVHEVGEVEGEVPDVTLPYANTTQP